MEFQGDTIFSENLYYIAILVVHISAIPISQKTAVLQIKDVYLSEGHIFLLYLPIQTVSLHTVL